MLTDQIKELTATRARLVELESSILAERNEALAVLPAQYGFPDVASFVSAVRAAAGKRRGRKPNAVAAPKIKGVKATRKRATITDATRGKVKKLLETGKTGSEIAAIVKVSLPSVHNIKKALGLVKKRSTQK